MTSVRFPGKMLAPFCDKPLLLNVINCIKKINENLQIILAISDDTADDPLALYGKDLKLQVLGPVGDIVSEWIIKGAMITSFAQGSFDWTSSEPAEVTLTVAMDYCVLNY